MRADRIRVSPKAHDKHPCHKRRQWRSRDGRGRACSHEATAEGRPGPPRAGGGKERKDPPALELLEGVELRGGSSLLLNSWPPEPRENESSPLYVTELVRMCHSGPENVTRRHTASVTAAGRRGGEGGTLVWEKPGWVLRASPWGDGLTPSLGRQTPVPQGRPCHWRGSLCPSSEPSLSYRALF